ncbi:MAG TPA: hypothetical protein VFQ61_00880, partial [Polyangiaceae bacterium]|nr:hypothetical protein [Polyangiaceae bacterium]
MSTDAVSSAKRESASAKSPIRVRGPRLGRRLWAWSTYGTKLLPHWAWLVPLLAVIVGVYTAESSFGRPSRNWPIFTDDYDKLADAFRSGHLYLDRAVNPELLQKDNPYDPKYENLWFGDSSLYKGRYYIYWGPLPALLQAIVKSALNIRYVLGDQYLVYAFWAVGTCATVRALDRLTRRLFGPLPKPLFWVCALAFAFMNPVIHLLTNAGVYQAAISGGQCFLLVGLGLALDVVHYARNRERQRVRMLAAGAAFAAAFGCRLSLAPISCLLLGITALYVGPLGQPKGSRRGTLVNAIRSAIWMGIPIVAGAALLALYNKLRFDDWFETGIKLQLSFLPYRFSVTYFPANIYNYLLQHFSVSSTFPYVRDVANLRGSNLPWFIAVPPGYFTGECLTGMLRAVPLVWLAPVAVLMLLGVGTRRLWARDSGRARLYAHAVLCMLTMGTLSAIPVFGLYVPSMRYLGDFTPGQALLGLMGGLGLYARVRTHPGKRRAVGALVVTLCVAT